MTSGQLAYKLRYGLLALSLLVFAAAVYKIVIPSPPSDSWKFWLIFFSVIQVSPRMDKTANNWKWSSRRRLSDGKTLLLSLHA